MTGRPNMISLLDARISDPIYRDIIGCATRGKNYPQNALLAHNFGGADVKLKNIDREM